MPRSVVSLHVRNLLIFLVAVTWGKASGRDHQHDITGRLAQGRAVSVIHKEGRNYKKR